MAEVPSQEHREARDSLFYVRIGGLPGAQIVGATAGRRAISAARAVTGILTAEEHARLASALQRWGVAAADIEDTLADAVFGPGAVCLPPRAPDLGHGLGILVDEQRDAELAILFDRRRRIIDVQDFVGDWEPGPIEVWSVLCPHAPEALIAFRIALRRPWPLRRTFLLLARKHFQVLHTLRHVGTDVWLVPQALGVRVSPTQATGYDFWGECLPITVLAEPMIPLTDVLEHAHPGGG